MSMKKTAEEIIKESGADLPIVVEDLMHQFAEYEAIGFAEWAVRNDWHWDGVYRIWYTNQAKDNEDKTTSELYQLYKQQNQ